MKIYLYSTLGCHLCEQAKIILWPLLLQYQNRLVEIDIAESDDLMATYGARIPVLAAALDSRNELSWPFSHEQVDNFFSQLAAF